VVFNSSMLLEDLWWDVWVWNEMQTRELEVERKFRNIGFRKMSVSYSRSHLKGVKQLLRCHRQPGKSITSLPKSVDLGVAQAILCHPCQCQAGRLSKTKTFLSNKLMYSSDKLFHLKVQSVLLKIQLIVSRV